MKDKGRILYEICRAETSKNFIVDSLPLEWDQLEPTTQAMWRDVTELVEAQRRVIRLLLAEVG